MLALPDRVVVTCAVFEALDDDETEGNVDVDTLVLVVSIVDASVVPDEVALFVTIELLEKNALIDTLFDVLGLRDVLDEALYDESRDLDQGALGEELNVCSTESETAADAV